MLPGLTFKPVKTVKFKEVKAKRAKVKSRAEVERARQRRKAERQKKRADWLQRRADRREEEKQRRDERGEPQVTKTRSKRRDPKSHHGTEMVDTTILKLLGKSHKSKKVAGKNKPNRVEMKKVGTQHGSEGAKWKPGMREEPREGWQEERKLKQQAEVESSSKKKKTTAGSHSQQTLPDFPPTPSPPSDVPPSPTFHPEATASIPPMPPCMEFYQVRRKQVTLSLTRIHGYNIFSFFAVIEFSPCSGARRPPLHPRSSPWQLASSSSKLHPCSSLLSTLPDSRTP